MTRDRGIVLVNALVIVLAISAVAAALLTRSEAARIRAGQAQAAHQLALYLDGVEGLVPGLLKEAEDGLPVHPGQGWAEPSLAFPIDRGAVAVRVADLQGRLNVNWLATESDYVRQTFTRVFTELGVPQALLSEIAAFVGPGGPGATAAYLSRRPPVLPRGGAAGTLDDLREVEGMTRRYFDLLRPVLAALPTDTRLNLNTAPEVVLRAAIAPLPPKLRTEILTRDAPLASISEIRNRAIELLQTEELGDMPFERFTASSRWFRADLTASLDGRQQRRQVMFRIDPAAEPPIIPTYRWAVYD